MLTVTKYINNILFALTLLLLTACAESSTVDVVEPAATVTFAMSIPQDPASRADNGNAYGDGTKATQLLYAVYSWANGTATLVETNVQYTPASGATSCYVNKSLTMQNRQATVNFNLAIGKTYRVVFWAQSPSAPYSFNPQTGAIDIDYKSEMLCSDDNLDAFCTCEQITVSASAATRTVTLTRPFAQLNLGDTTNADVTKTSLIVTSVATTYNLVTGEKSNFEPCEFSFNATPASNNIDFPVETAGAQYVAMAYFIPTSDSQDVDIYLGFSENDYDYTKFMESISVKPNSRTNVYGDVFTLEDHDDYYLRYSDNTWSLFNPKKMEYVGNGEYIYKYGENIGTFSESCGILIGYSEYPSKYWSAATWASRPTNQDFTDDDKNSYGYLNAHLNCEYSYPVVYASYVLSGITIKNKIFITGSKKIDNLIIRFNPTKKTLYFTGNYVD